MPPLVEDVKHAIHSCNRFVEVVGEIARGRKDNGRPLAAETARQMAREVLDELGFVWPPEKGKL
jgi:hypothetical protein